MTIESKLYKTNKIESWKIKQNMATWHLATIPVGGAIRALMMCIHAYFNIWCEARAGWGVFMKRRTAVHKISSLPEATPLQLRSFDDVCAICYQVSVWSNWCTGTAPNSTHFVPNFADWIKRNTLKNKRFGIFTKWWTKIRGEILNQSYHGHNITFHALKMCKQNRAVGWFMAHGVASCYSMCWFSGGKHPIQMK